MRVPVYHAVVAPRARTHGVETMARALKACALAPMVTWATSARSHPTHAQVSIVELTVFAMAVCVLASKATRGTTAKLIFLAHPATTVATAATACAPPPTAPPASRCPCGSVMRIMLAGMLGAIARVEERSFFGHLLLVHANWLRRSRAMMSFKSSSKFVMP
eukprot:SAG11_NODE_332_length_10621_cov_13.178768_2_plen_162_part_00